MFSGGINRDQWHEMGLCQLWANKLSRFLNCLIKEFNCIWFSFSVMLKKVIVLAISWSPVMVKSFSLPQSFRSKVFYHCKKAAQVFRRSSIHPFTCILLCKYAYYVYSLKYLHTNFSGMFTCTNGHWFHAYSTPFVFLRILRNF